MRSDNDMYGKRLKNLSELLYVVCWLVYLGLLVYIVLFKGSWDETRAFVEMVRQGTALGRRKVYLRPFESTKMFLGLWEYAYARWNVIGNILLFMPFGILTRGLWNGPKGLFCTFCLALATSSGFEIIQFLYAIGEFDVDDIILNVSGAAAGYGAANLCSVVFPTVKRRKKHSDHG